MITRATLPQEFFDITSDMLLVQPEPQYLHGMLAKMALGASLQMGEGLGIAPGRAFSGPGADYGTPEGDRLMLADPIASEAVVVIPELGRPPGATVKINRPVFADSTYTPSSREVASGAQISTTPVDISSQQVQVTLKRYAGPYDQANTRVAPLAADRFDAQLPVHKVASILGKQLKRDFDKTLDRFMVALFDAAQTVVVPQGFADSDAFTTQGDAPLDFNTLARTELALDEANIPMFANGKRICVLHPRQVQQLKDDQQFARYVSYDMSKAGVNPVFSSTFVGSIGRLNIFQSNTLTKGANGNSVDVYTGQAFGPGMVGLGAGSLPRAAFSTADNYGEQALVIWLWYAGFATLDQRFGVRVQTS